MINIFYDHQAFSLQNYGGVSRIFSELLKGMENNDQFHAYLSLLFSNNTHLQEIHYPVAQFFPLLQFPKKQGLLYKLNQLKSYYDINHKKFDIYHPTYYNPSLISLVNGRPVVATFHDMIHEKFASQFTELASDRNVIEQKKQLADISSHIIAVSENTKNDIVNYYNIDPNKITVVHLGSSFIGKEISTEKKKTLKPYLLYVGNRTAYKNFIFFLKSISSLLIKNNILLICAGGGEFSADEMNIIHSLHLNYFVKQKSITDEILADLYSNALAFIFPSLYEGFGIPILEAFSCNCPCIVSNTSSLPEVAGNAACYINPSDSDSIMQAVDKVVHDSTYRNDLVLKGQARLKNFSWHKHVEQTIDIYKQIKR